MARTMGRLYDYTTELEVEAGLRLTHLTLKDKHGKVEIELDEYKVKKLIQMLENSIK